ncbi:hypothetical protein CDL12_29917 [Handroanthus impetiginosus]|uniref:Uncharacterized protein n=1 Tax=Handroanthus impetiginosus TaxID=429701 RepID=A0A2G9FX35_9LAMI|nr:hypothetical protein CDL12_29917 [Handroanthus impetiginosus]
MAEIILTPFLQVIIEKLAHSALQKIADLWEPEDRFKKLQSVLPMAQAVIQDAEERQMTDKAVRIWLRRLRDAAWKADDLLEEFMYHRTNYNCTNRYNINFINSRNILDFCQKKSHILDDLHKAVVEGINLTLVGSKIMDKQFEMRETSSFFIGSEVCGREEEKREILEKLLMPSVGIQSTGLEKGLAQMNLGQVYHASIVSDYGSFTIPETLHQAKHLRTLLIFSEGGFQTVPSDIFSSFIYLRMLILSGSLVKLPESIGKLSILKSLDLSNSHFDELLSALSSLCLLETLNLFGCYNLKRLPSMRKITGLRHLNISGCEALMEMPDGIDKLVQLQTLPIYIVPIPLRNCVLLEGITGLKGLNLRGELKIKHLERVHDVEEAKGLNLLDKEYLQSLGLCWGNAGSDFIMNPFLESNAARFQQRKPHESGPSEDPEPSYPTVSNLGLSSDVLAFLQPHKNLKKLFIVGYPGIKFAEWTLPNLTDVVLINCGGCLHLPILGHLPLLRSLRMEGIKSIIYIGQEICGEDVEVSFPSLQELFMRDFPVLEEWHLELRRCNTISLNCMEDLM